MPKYDYQCTKCGQVVEIQKRMDEPDPEVHTPDRYVAQIGTASLDIRAVCGGHLVQVIRPPAIRFVGHGFYVNDYGKGR